MEMPKNYEETEGITGDYETLPVGGYICKIVSAKEEKSQAGNAMLVLALDIAEGEYAGFFSKRYEELKRQNQDPNNIVKYPNNAIHRIMVFDKEGNCNKFFKGFGTIIEESNSGYKWTGDEKTLKGKVLGAIFAEEEYEKRDGSIGTSCKIRQIRTLDAIRNNKFKIPEKKVLTYTVPASSSDDDLPF